MIHQAELAALVQEGRVVGEAAGLQVSRGIQPHTQTIDGDPLVDAHVVGQVTLDRLHKGLKQNVSHSFHSAPPCSTLLYPLPLLSLSSSTLLPFSSTLLPLSPSFLPELSRKTRKMGEREKGNVLKFLCSTQSLLLKPNSPTQPNCTQPPLIALTT